MYQQKRTQLTLHKKLAHVDARATVSQTHPTHGQHIDVEDAVADAVHVGHLTELVDWRREAHVVDEHADVVEAAEKVSDVLVDLRIARVEVGLQSSNLNVVLFLCLAVQKRI